MIEVEAALARIFERVSPLASARDLLREAHGRVAARDVIAPRANPPFDNSAMDGYAARCEDLVAAGPHSPVALKLRGETAAGQSKARIGKGECSRVFTGAVLPDGADVVVMQEDTQALSEDIVEFIETPKPWEHIRFRGEDIEEGAVVVSKGEELTAGRIAAMASLGIDRVDAIRRPKVGLIATGSELVEPGAEAPDGAIYESNRIMLEMLVRAAGCSPVVYPICRDEPESVQALYREAMETCDVALSTGGVSVGDYDFGPKSFEAIGGETVFHRVRVKPGKPVYFGILSERAFFGLPGNPLSAFVTFLLFCRPALQRLRGGAEQDPITDQGVARTPFLNRGDRPTFLRVVRENDGGVRLAGAQGSHQLSALLAANRLLRLAPGESIQIGDSVELIRWD